MVKNAVTLVEMASAGKQKKQGGFLSAAGAALTFFPSFLVSRQFGEAYIMKANKKSNTE